MRFSTVSVNSDAVRRIQHIDGREYLVAPVVMIVEGVLNDALVPASEISHFFQSWSGRPVILNHPLVGGQPVSANNPTLDVTECPGRIWNPVYNNGTLKAEMWLDILKTESIGGTALEIMQRLEEGKPVEVSTGYFADFEPATGTWKGEEYSYITRNIIPDHLALLPDAVGACSWADGCGAPRVNQVFEQGASAFIAFMLTPDQIAGMSLDLPEGAEPTPTNQLHVTLAYFGKTEDLEISENDLLEALASFVRYAPIVRGRVNGLARFGAEDERDAIVATIDSPGLVDWRESLVWWVEDVAYISRDHAFVPHITLAYIPSESSITFDNAINQDLVFSRVALVYNGNVTFFPLQGEAAELETLQKRPAERNPIKALFFNLMDVAKNIISTGDESMKRKEAIEYLVGNEKCKLPKDLLEKMDDDTLTILAGGYKAEEKKEDVMSNTEGEGEEAEAEDTETQPAGDESDDLEQQTAAPETDTEEVPAWAKTLVSKVEQIEKQLTGNTQKERREKIATLLKAQTIFNEKDLQALPDAALDKLMKANAATPQSEVLPGAYIGQGYGVPQQNQGEWVEWGEFANAEDSQTN